MDMITFLGTPVVLSALIMLLAFLFACVLGFWFGIFISTYAPELSEDERMIVELEQDMLQHSSAN